MDAIRDQLAAKLIDAQAQLSAIRAIVADYLKPDNADSRECMARIVAVLNETPSRA